MRTVPCVHVVLLLASVAAVVQLSCKASDEPGTSFGRGKGVSALTEVEQPNVPEFAAANLPMPLQDAEIKLMGSSPRSRVPASVDLPINSPKAAVSGFAEIVAVSDDSVVIASPRAATGMRIFRGTSGALTEEARFEPFDGDTFNTVSLSLSADSVAVGIPTPTIDADDDSTQLDRSRVKTYRRGAKGWYETAPLALPASAVGGHFGHSSAVNDKWLSVGAPEVNGGAAYIYEREGDTWRLQAELAGIASGSDKFGWSVALDGDTLVVGAPCDGGSAGKPKSTDRWGTGAVYVFNHDASGKWTQNAVLKASDAPLRSGPVCHGMGCLSYPRAVEEFGYSVAIANGRIVVGAPGSGTPRIPEGSPFAPGPGGAYVFSAVPGTSPPVWREEARLEAPKDAKRFGAGVSLTDAAIGIGAPGKQPVPGGVPSQVDTGTVLLFAKNATKGWVPDVTVTTPTEPGVPYSRFALTANRLVLSGFRRGANGGFARTFNLARTP